MTSGLPTVRTDVAEMPPYKPVLPLETRAERLGLAVERLVKLDANENPYGAPPAVQRALAHLPNAHIYPDPQSRRLRAALSAFHGIPAENLLVGAGADELIDLVLRLFLDPGDAVLTCPPTFGMYEFDTLLNRGRMLFVPRRADFSLDLDAIAAVVRAERPKLLFLATPNNPDGGLPTQEQIARLLDLPVYLVLDEAYIEFALPGRSMLRAVLERENLIVLRTFSKWGGLAGLRVGYGAFPLHIVEHLWKIKQPYSVSVAAEAAALAVLSSLDELHARTQRIIAERARLFSALQAVPWLEPYPSQANFILCRVKEYDARVVHAELARRGILLRYFDKPGLRGFIRISVGTPFQTEALLRALREIHPW